MRGLSTAALALALCAGAAFAGRFDDEDAAARPGVRLSGLLDVRAFATDRGVSWLKGGPNPLRYGGRDTDQDSIGDRHLLGGSIPQASLVVEADVQPWASVHLQGNFSIDAPSGTPKIGLIEAYADLQGAIGDDALRLRLGGFIPPLSWEHPDLAWSTRYTLTPSAIGTWVGEEVRGFGAEGLWERPWASWAATRLTGGVFAGGDQIGRLLWFRGWALHDYQGDLAAEYPLLGRRVRPLEELDGRQGYYGRGDAKLLDGLIQAGGGLWTNNGDEGIGRADNSMIDSQPFRTEAVHYGGKLEHKRLTVIGQSLKATVSFLGRAPRDWSAAYGLVSWAPGRLRLSYRYDRFWTINVQSGFVHTAFASWSPGLSQQVGVEYVHSVGRPSQPARPRSEVDRLVSLNYRWRYR